MNSIIGKNVEFIDVSGNYIKDTVKEVLKLPRLGWIYIVMTDEKMYEVTPEVYKRLLEEV